MRFFPALLLLLGFAVKAQAAAPPAPTGPVEIQVYQISAAGLLTELATVTGRQVAVSAELIDPTVTLTGLFTSPEELMSEISRQAGGRQQRAAGFEVFAGPCTPQPTRLLPDGVATKKVTAYFQRGSLQPVLLALGDYASTAKSNRAFRSAADVRVAVSAKEQPVRDVFNALAIANGLALQQDKGGFVFSPLPAREGCTAPAVPAKTYAPPRDISNQACPERDTPPPKDKKQPSCMQLELYALKELWFAGYMKMGPTAMAIVATPDGLVKSLRVGDYVGRYDGRVKAIAREGLWLKEVIPRAEEGHMEREVFIAFGRVADFPLSGPPIEPPYQPLPFACPEGLRHEKAEIKKYTLNVDKCVDARGRKQGLYRVTRQSNGTVAMESHYVDDKTHGVQYHYDSSGVIETEITDEHGEQVSVRMRHRGLEKLAAEFNENRRRAGRPVRMVVTEAETIRYEVDVKDARQLKGEVEQRQRRLSEGLCPLWAQHPFPEAEVRMVDPNGATVESHLIRREDCAAGSLRGNEPNR